MSKTLKVVRLTADARLPSKGSRLAAGYDLYAAEAAEIAPHGKAVVTTGLSIQVPAGTYGRIAPRSGLAAKHHIDVGAGVVDEDYRGTVGVVLFNHSPSNAFKVNVGDRIAQLVCEKIAYPDLEECNELDGTERGVKGFGSTGIRLQDKENTSNNLQ